MLNVFVLNMSVGFGCLELLVNTQKPILVNTQKPISKNTERRDIISNYGLYVLSQCYQGFFVL